MKRTAEDEQFGAEFARQLRPHYEKALAEGQTEIVFARRLGVNRGGLQRYLKKHATPSLRTLVFAYREFGIAIAYAGVATIPVVSKKAKRRSRRSTLQMELPLTIEAPEGEIELSIKKKDPQSLRLQLRVIQRA